MQNRTARGEDKRQTHDGLLILDMLANKGIMRHPEFAASSVEADLSLYRQRHGRLPSLDGPVYLWAGELADHPVMKEAQDILDQIRAVIDSRLA